MSTPRLPTKTKVNQKPGRVAPNPVSDPINPGHYRQGEVECIDAIESALGRDGFIAFLRGQVMKYQWRLLDKGNPTQDNQKAIWYANKLAKVLENEVI